LTALQSGKINVFSRDNDLDDVSRICFQAEFVAAGFGSTEISAGGLDARPGIYEAGGLGRSNSNEAREECETGRAAMAERRGLSQLLSRQTLNVKRL